MMSSIWNHNPPTNGKQINGTYWMHYRATMFQLKSDFKDVSRTRHDLGDATADCFLSSPCILFSLHAPKFMLNGVAMTYFILGIFLCKFRKWQTQLNATLFAR